MSIDDIHKFKMENQSVKQESKIGAWLRKNISKPLGFNKLYNLPLFIIFAGALLGFSLARLSYLQIDGGKSKSSFSGGSSPGEWYHYHTGHYRIGLTLHLASCLPLGILVIFQFVPIIRHKLLIIHRLNGYLCILLGLTSNAGALMITRRAFGGTLDIQAGFGVLAILTTTSLGMAYWNIKKLQIDQHRAWMLRAFFYFGTIITIRIIMIIAAQIITAIGTYNAIRSCDEITFMHDGNLTYTAQQYPICADDQDHPVIVSADFGTTSETTGASLGLSFGMATWLAIFLHLVGVEIYLRLTPAESERLRMVSYERQVEAGMKCPGSAGLTVDRWGDAEPWVPLNQRGHGVAEGNK